VSNFVALKPLIRPFGAQVVMLKQRVLTAIVLLAGFLASLFLLPQAGWLVLVSLVCAGGAWEWGGLNNFGAWPRRLFAIALGMVCLLLGLLAGVGGDPAEGFAGGSILLVAYLASAILWIALVPNWLRAQWRIRSGMVAVLLGLVVLVPPALALAHLRQIDAWLLLAALVIVWVADIAAYFAGRAFGRHKLAPAISPGKTWEGAGGAVIGVVVVGSLLVATLRPDDLSLARLAILVPVLTVFTAVSIIGDLFESMLKRHAGIKDSGNLLPGHGGILDRIDSITSTLPLMGLAALWLLP